MSIKFSMCDGRHVAADEESALLYRMHTVVVCTFYRLRSPLRHQRRRSLVFVVIIADECERERRTGQANAKDGKRKQTKWKEHIYQLYVQIRINDYYCVSTPSNI